MDAPPRQENNYVPNLLLFAYLMYYKLQLPRSTAETREEMDAEERQENNALYSQVS
jgi:hypothetical protein